MSRLHDSVSMLGHGVVSFVRGPRSTKLMAIEALWQVPRALLVIRCRSFGDACRQLGTRTSDLTVPDRSLSFEQRRAADAIGHIVRPIAVILGGIDTCFAQSIAATRMLNRRGVSTFALIGIRPGAHVTLDSHAWIFAGQRIITGGGPHRFHEPVLAFDSPGSAR